MENIKLAQRFFKYYFKADTLYQVHSPFVYDFVENVLEDDRHFYAFESVEYLRRLLKQNKKKISVTDLGAGSKTNSRQERSISSIAKSAASRKWQCQILFRMINYLQPKMMLELGTSLGISTIYQASAALNTPFVTMEGDPQIAAIARQHFKEFKLKNVQVVEGHFDHQLPGVLQKMDRLDYLFLDGNHRKTPTLQYFELCLEKAHNDSVFVIDDIHWSEEMESAWEELKKHPKVRLTIDLYHMGIVFFRKEHKEVEHYVLAPLAWKPWASGRVF